MSEAVLEITSVKSEESEMAVYEHPLLVRICHWLNVGSLFVMIGSGLQIFRAFPSFGPKIPQVNLLHWPRPFALGGWLGGGLQWHLTFMWIYMATGLVYIGYQLVTGNYRQVLFVPRDIPGIWPMVRHYFFFGPKPPATEAYNPLQKQAYTTVLILGVLSVLTGFAIWKPAQFSWLAWLMGGFHYARIWHFAVMWAIIFFIFGHLVMVILHGWSNFVSMLTGWKTNPDYPVGWQMPAPPVATPAEATEDDSIKHPTNEPIKEPIDAESSSGKSASPLATHDEPSQNEQSQSEPRN
ncbi:MAG: cytochrome b/b6 domain-containing protein [Terriglobales bacterium]